MKPKPVQTAQHSGLTYGCIAFSVRPAAVRKVSGIPVNVFPAWATAYSPGNFPADLRAGLTLLASYVPACMAFGIVSGMGPVAGLHSAVIVGVLAALFGGTKALVSGPSIALAVVVASVLADSAALSDLAVIVAMAGVFQILFGLTGAGRYIAYLPHIVLTGFMSGIGVLLFWSQGRRLVELGPEDIAVAGASLAVLLVWPKRFDAVVPRGLVGVAAGIAASVFLPGATLLGAIPAGLPAPDLSMPTADSLRNAVGPALLIALVSTVYSLMLCLTADSITGGRHRPNRQIAALGIGNTAAGILGALPGGANLGTVITLRYGSRTVVAGLVAAAGVAALLLGFGRHAASLPLAALIAIVFPAAWGVVEWRFLAKIPRVEKRYAVVMLLTMGLVVFVDPLMAVVFGLVAAHIVNAAGIETLELDSVVSVPLLDRDYLPDADDGFSARAGLLQFRGAFTVASSHRLVHTIGDDIRDHEAVIFDLSQTTYIDDSAAHLMAELLLRARQTGTPVIVSGIPDGVRGALDSFDALASVPEARIVDTLDEARALAAEVLADAGGA